jgi:hypothetical protein
MGDDSVCLIAPGKITLGEEFTQAPRDGGSGFTRRLTLGPSDLPAGRTQSVALLYLLGVALSATAQHHADQHDRQGGPVDGSRHRAR